jgi:hypothetical protein
MSRGALLDLRLRTTWKRGPSAGAGGPLLISLTVFTPDTLRDLPHIYGAAERLREACRELEGAVGVISYWQPLRRRGGSLSAWTDAAALRRFVALPYHREIMRRYRTRGTVQATSWNADAFDIATAFRDGFAALEGSAARAQPA